MKIKKYKLKMFSDDRGILTFASVKILKFKYKYLTMGTLKPKTIRGGHYHKRIKEKLLCLSGKMIFKLNDDETELKSGDIVDIPINCVHTIYNFTNKEASFIEFKSEEFNEHDTDTYTQ